MSERYPADFAARWKKMRQDVPVHVNCFSAVLYLLDCIAEERYMVPTRNAIHTYFDRIGIFGENADFEDFPEAQAVAIWDPRLEAGSYRHIVCIPPKDDSGWVYERPDYEQPAQVSSIWKVLRIHLGAEYLRRTVYMLAKK